MDRGHTAPVLPRAASGSVIALYIELPLIDHDSNRVEPFRFIDTGFSQPHNNHRNSFVLETSGKKSVLPERKSQFCLTTR